jgi:serine/threonine protein phosphatase PrpC
MKSIISYATQTHKTTVNQDFACSVNNEKAEFNGIIVADGIGGHSRSELSSKFCTEKLKEKLEALNSSIEIDFNKIFFEIRSELILFAKDNLSFDELRGNPLGTTLICSLELKDEYQIAYIGNGSIWQISGNFNHFGKNRYIPWNSINLLCPHTVEEDGKSKLFKYISILDSVDPSPSIIRLSKNEKSFGDILVITTDGIFTNDEVRIGKDDNGVVWTMGDDTMLILYDTLNALLTNNPNSFNEDDLKFELEKYLTILKDKKIMHDDTTLGIIISPKVFQYQKSKLENSFKADS